MADYSSEELEMLKSYKGSPSSSDDYSPEELAILKNHAKATKKLGTMDSILNQATKFGKGVVGGAEELDRGLYNLPPHILEAVGIKSPYQAITAQQMGSDKYLTPDVVNSVAGASGQALPALASMFIPGSAEVKGAMTAGKMLEPTAALAARIPKTALGYIQDLLGSYGKNVVAGAAATPLFSPDQSIGEAVKSGLTSPANYALSALGPGMQVGSDTLQKLLQMKRRAGGVNPTETVLANQEALKNTVGDQKAPPGQIIKSPLTNWVQSFLSMTPGAKMNQAMMGLGKSFEGATNDILGSLIPKGKGVEGKTSIPEDVAAEVKKNYSDPLDAQIQGALDQLSGKKDTQSNRGAILSDIQKDVKNNYTDVTNEGLKNSLAQMTSDPNVLTNAPQYRGQIQEDFAKHFKNDKEEVEKNYRAANDFSASKGETILPIHVAEDMEPTYQEMTEELQRNPQAKIDHSLYNELQDLHNIIHPQEKSGQSEILDKNGQPIYSLSKAKQSVEKNARPLSSVNDFRKKYNDKADDAFRRGDRKDAANWRKLWVGYTKDIKSQLSDESADLWEKANDSYKEKLVPIYNSDELLGHALKKSSPDSIVEDVLKTGDSERPDLLRNFTSRLNPDSVGKLAALHYTKPLRKVNGRTVMEPDKMLNQHDKLGDQTRDILFNSKPAIRNGLDSLNQSFNKELYQYGSGEKAPETLMNKFVRTGAYERPDLARTLMDVVSPQNKGKVAALQATKGMKNNLDPKKVISNISKLDPETQAHLYAQHPEMKKLFDMATKRFDPDLYDFGKGNTPPDKIISKYMPNGKEESPTLSNQLLNVLSPQGRQAVTSHLLTGGRRALKEEDRARGYTVPGVLRDYNQMEDRTQQSLLRDRPDLQKRFADLTKSTGIYGDTINPMLMPKNGITVAGQKPINDILDAAATTVSSGLSKKAMKAALHTVSFLLAKSGIGNVATKHLLDPKFLKKYLESRQEIVRKNTNQMPISLINAALQGNNPAQQDNQ